METNITCPKKLHLSAPLPFVGQKRMFAKHFIEVIKQYPQETIFVDLFGGSGLLSHITKYNQPGSRVIYNDYDNYRRRIENIQNTNGLLSQIRPIAAQFPRNKPITGESRSKIFKLIEQEQQKTGFVDYITLSTSLMFSMKYCVNLESMHSETLYNKVRKNDYNICPDYFDGIEIESCDYLDIFSRYKDTPGVVFIVDPPYLSTDVDTYRMCWKLSDYLDVLKVLAKHDFIYFTSEKSSIIELCEWIGQYWADGNPFTHCKRKEFYASLNYGAHYKDIMLYTPPPTVITA